MKNFAFTSQIDNNFFKVIVTFDGDFYKVTAKEKFNGKCYIITGYKVSAKQAESAKQAFLIAFNAVFSNKANNKQILSKL